ncbi:MAG TPA: hypothetical protein VF701_18090 [Thermoanaerobaculia bacterium]
MNAHVFAATPETVEALRSVVGRAAEAVAAPEAVAILTPEKALVIEVEAEDFETNFECYRLVARETDVRPFQRTITLGTVLRIELLTSEEWIEAAVGPQPPGFIGEVQAYQQSGFPGAAPSYALAKCVVDDAVLIVGTHRELLVRCDVMAYQLIVATDGVEISEQVAERQSRILPAG